MAAATPVKETVDMLGSALEYVKRGVPVFPLYGITHDGKCECGNPECGSPGKHPRTSHGLLDASADEMVARRWWRDWPTANIGMPTGTQVGVLALDVDPRHGGLESLQALIEEFGEIPATREVNTGGGGHHLFFRCPNPSPKNSQALLGPGLDIRAAGGYVVLPPSLHESGRRYEWVESQRDAPPAKFPAWMLERLTQKGVSGGAQAAADRINVASVLEGVAEGQRDQALFRVAAKMRYADVPMAMAEAMILEAAAKCIPPLPAEEARAKVASAYGRYDATLKGLEEGQTVVAQTLDDDTVRVVTACEKGPVEFIFRDLEKSRAALDTEMTMRFLLPGTPDKPYVQRINLLSVSARESCRRELDAIYGKDVKWAKLLIEAGNQCADQFLKVDRTISTADMAIPSTMEYLIDRLVPLAGTTIFFGAGSAAKTFITMQMSICIANGLPFLGRACEKRNVLFVDYETGEEMFALRMNRIRLGMQEEYPGVDIDLSRVRYLNAQGIPLLDLSAALRQAVDRHNSGVLVIDHAASAAGTKPEDSDAALRVKRALGPIKLPAILIAHITGDGEKNPAEVLRPFGSIFWSNLARRTWYVSRVQDQESDHADLGFYCRKNNDGRKPGDFGITVDFTGEVGPIRFGQADLRETPKLMANRPPEYQIQEVLTEPMTAKEITAATGLSRSTVDHTLPLHPNMFQSDVAWVGKGRTLHWTRVS